MKQLHHPSRKAITLTGVLSALSDPVRLSIVTTLADGCEHHWGELEVDVGLSTLSHHVKVLREAGIINHRKQGTRCFLTLRPDLEQVLPGLLASVLRFAGRSGGKSEGRSGSRGRRRSARRIQSGGEAS